MYSDESEEPRYVKQSGNRSIIVLSIVINLMLAGVCGILYQQNNLLQDEIQQYAGELSTASESLAAYEQQLNMTLTQLDYYKILATEVTASQSTVNGSASILGRATVPVVTVRTIQYGFSVTYEGEILQAEVELIQGEGRVLVDTEVINGADVQTSLRTAADVVAGLTGVSFSGTDIILTIEGASDVEMVDGPSAGAAITMAIYAAVTGQQPVDGVYMTGTISSDGSVGTIGGVQYKGVAVAEDGGVIFLVPEGQSTLTTYQAVTRQMGRSTFTFYEPVTVELEEYLSDLGYNVSIVEIGSIDEVIPYFFEA